MRVLLIVLKSELRQLVRDRRALFFAILLPAVLYPLVFFSQGELEDIARETLEAREVHIALDLSRVEPEFAARVRTRLAAETPIQLIDTDASEVLALDEGPTLDPDVLAAERRAVVERLLNDQMHVLVIAEPRTDLPTGHQLHIYFDVKDDTAREGRDRARTAFGDLRDELELQARETLIGVDPARGLATLSVDVATAEDAGGAAIGRLLPFLAVLVLLSGGSYAALAAFAGEREAGTLETLLVQPVSAAPIAYGKYCAVLVAGFATLFVNLASLVACMQFGLADLPGLTAEGGGGIAIGRLLAGLAYLPGCMLLCAILCLVCGRARTFREGQLLVFPVTIAALIPTALVFLPDIETSALLAAIPLGGAALILRDALAGSLRTGPLLVMIVSHLAYVALALSRLAHLLDADRVLSSDRTQERRNRHDAIGSHALRWGFITVLSVYTIGGSLQAWRLRPGLFLTFWVGLPLLALFISRGTARRARTHWTRELGLRRPRLAHLVGALLLAPALGRLALWFVPIQMEWLPMPTSSTEGLDMETILPGATAWSMFFFFALSPGLWEELVFRGALQKAMRHDYGPGRTILWQALLFGAAHASIYRLVPTATLGALFAVIAWRSRSVWPTMLLHIAYNGQLVLNEYLEAWTAEQAEAGRTWIPEALTTLPYLAIPGVLLLLLTKSPGPESVEP